MLSERMEKTLNEQVNAEFYSSYLYLSMSAYFRKINLNGFARWMEVQALEEMTHAMKIYNFLIDRGKTVVLTPIAGPKTSWTSPLEAFQDAYNHELKVTSLINNLMNIAVEERDHASNSFLQWFVNEQVEEESSADEVVQKLKMIGDNSGGLYMLDQEMGARLFTPPPGTTIIAGMAASKA
ncbi:MAG: ferritin [Acidobacteriota bacterium]